MLGMHTAQLFSSYRNDRLLRGCLESRNVVRDSGIGVRRCTAVPCLLYIVLYYINAIIFICIMTKYEYMTCLISCTMIDGHEINK
jgi:hypothetical protein